MPFSPAWEHHRVSPSLRRRPPKLEERIARAPRTLGEMAGMAEMFGGTIHAFCLELLKSVAQAKHEVLNEVQRKDSSLIGTAARVPSLAPPDLWGRLRRSNGLGAVFFDRDTRALRDRALHSDEAGATAQLDCSSVRWPPNVSATCSTKRATLITRRFWMRLGRAADQRGALRARLADRRQVRNRRRVPGRQSHPGRAIVWSLHELGARICVGRRRRPDHLPMARQRRRQHPDLHCSATRRTRSRLRRTSAPATAS